MSTLKWLLVRWHVNVAVFLLGRLGEPQQATRLRLVADKIHARKRPNTSRDIIEIGLLAGPVVFSILYALMQVGLLH